ncbi:hypothetical protein ONZ51_g1378 [Trametes cubensis]|uniref:Uncharacterized protein n=1 Tax=Trametes cubensis TaxID=1111947 RepID=A0AAD7XHP1_9APHY|nr:hypothetical protein ONZ51_g1378 [Trametes cubensis]
MESARRVGARGGGHDGDACERKPKEGGTSSHGSVTRCEGSVPVQGEGACEFEPDSQTDTAAADDLSVRRRHRNAVLYSAADVVATPTLVTTSSPRPPFSALVRSPSLSSPLGRFFAAISRRDRRDAPPEPRAKDDPGPIEHTAVDAPQTICTTRTPAHAPPYELSPRHGELTEQSEPQTPPSLSPSPLPHTPSLRRKRRMSVLRQRSSCSLRRRATTSGSTATHRRSETAPSAPASPRSKAHSVRFSSPPPSLPTSEPDAFPLGHPQRPLYTAIRKNMSRPSSPAPSMGSGHSAAVDAAFQTTVYERQTRSLDLPRFNSLGRSYLSMAAYTRPVLFPPSASGFSVSGETELRMDLARSRSMDGVPSDFAFRETKPDASTVKAKVKSLGKTLKSLLRGGKA